MLLEKFFSRRIPPTMIPFDLCLHFQHDHMMPRCHNAKEIICVKQRLSSSRTMFFSWKWTAHISIPTNTTTFNPSSIELQMLLVLRVLRSKTTVVCRLTDGSDRRIRPAGSWRSPNESLWLTGLAQASSRRTFFILAGVAAGSESDKWSVEHNGCNCWQNSVRLFVSYLVPGSVVSPTLEYCATRNRPWSQMPCWKYPAL